MSGRTLAWSGNIGGLARCKFCLKTVGAKPSNECPEGHKRYYTRHLEKARVLNDSGRLRLRGGYWAVRYAVITMFGGKCAVCGIDDIRVLQINHINGGGNKDEMKGQKLYRALLKGRRDKDGFDLRCANCNILYEFDKGKRGVWAKLNGKEPA